MQSESKPSFDALTVVSPLACGGDDKNQDRARWSPYARVASVCDGVTSSPRSSEAADLVTDLAPMLFKGDVRERLGGICDLLYMRRLQVRDEPVVLSPATPPCMHEMLLDVTRERMKIALQTTLVAAAFTATDNGTVGDVVRCGDSAFFAFSPSGELLASSPAWAPTPAAVDACACSSSRGIRFGPGDKILVKVLGRASSRELAPQASQIRAKYRKRWLVCTPLDGCTECDPTAQQGTELPTFWLTADGRLLVPEYLIGGAPRKCGEQYESVLYSSSIRLASNTQPAASAISFTGSGAVTEVLPDHYISDRWVHRQEHFPSDAQFLLASDGFYGAFDGPRQLWNWLAANKSALAQDKERSDLMLQLHERLQSKSGDDDMSFVWIFPTARPQRTCGQSASPQMQEGNIAMPFDVLRTWLSSGKPARLDGTCAQLAMHPMMHGEPIVVERGQAAAVMLSAEDSTRWVLKKFHQGRCPDESYVRGVGPLLPRHDSLLSGTNRRVLSTEDLKDAPGCYFSHELATWLNGTILMPRVAGVDWAAVADDVRGQPPASPA